MRATDAWPAMVGMCVLGTVLAIDPLRETAFTDDWVYATMVRTFLDTGDLNAHPWAAANPTFLTGWGAAFSQLLGFSFASLRVSALVLWAVGLSSFFLLCREHGLRTRESSVLTLVFLSSPLVIRHAFSFMTDVPFVALSLLAILLYTRALRSRHVLLMLAASLVAAAAVLTRQFGAVFLPALLAAWLVGRPRSWNVRLSVVAAALPLAATLWQLQQGTSEQAWTAQYRSAEQVAFLTSWRLPLDLLWRAHVIPLYLALFALPVVLTLRRHDQVGASSKAPDRRMRAAYVASCIAALYVGGRVLAHPVLMPLLDWNLAAMAAWPLAVRLLITGSVVWLGARVCAAVVERYVDSRLRPAGTAERVLDGFFLFLLLSQLAYVQFADRYLLAFIPFVLIVMGRRAWLERPATPTELRRVTVVAIVLLVISTAWTRATLDRGEALWRGGEWLRLQGVPAELIHSESWEWDYYHGSFDRWLASHPAPRVADFNDFFDRYWPDTWRNARYAVSVRPPGAIPTGRVLWTAPIRDAYLRRRFVDVTDRRPAGRGPESP